VARRPAADPAGRPPIILDLSRLVSRLLHPTPTGVDRVEMAYALGLHGLVPDRLRFAAVHSTGLYGRIPTGSALAFLRDTEALWRDKGQWSRAALRRRALSWLWALRPQAPTHAEAGAVFVQASPNHLTDPRVTQRILARERARFLILVHDLIPLEFPEYARPDGAALHRRRVDTIVAHADAVLANSHATLDALQPHLRASGRSPLQAAAPLGTERSALRGAPAPGRPYFLCVGTIEPRKNHLLLLNLWRRWAERDGTANIPRLLVVGRRGWENEQVIDMLERSPALKGCVEEHGRLPDGEVQRLMAGTHGLLLPSFAEGYGMPVSEAIAMDVPVLCSDLPALREAGGPVADYLDPLDGPAWMAAVADLATDASRIAAAQRERRAGWRPPGWPDHLALLLQLVDGLAR
jgi:glycosyltransferase involved in cell wall biosynthesis